jgi:hypothetical protein
MNDHEAKLRQCMARFEGYLLVDGLSAELTAVYRAEIEADRAMLNIARYAECPNGALSC